MLSKQVAGTLTFLRTQRLAGIVLWLAMLMLVVAGELLPGQSEPIMWLSRSHLSDKVVHLTAYAAVALDRRGCDGYAYDAGVRHGLRGCWYCARSRSALHPRAQY